MARNRTADLIAGLAAGVDLERILHEFHLTPASAVMMLRRGNGKRRIAEWRALSKIHARLVANRFSTFAVHRLCELLQSEKPELRLKGALSVLNISGLAKRPARGRARAKGEAGSPAEDHLTEAERELVEALAEIMSRRKGEQKE